jgi:hypothetical protein
VGLPQRQKRLCFLSYQKIASAAGCARSTVAEAINALEDAGILSWVNRINRVREPCPDLLGVALAGAEDVERLLFPRPRLVLFFQVRKADWSHHSDRRGRRSNRAKPAVHPSDKASLLPIRCARSHLRSYRPAKHLFTPRLACASDASNSTSVQARWRVICTGTERKPNRFYRKRPSRVAP